MSVRCFGHIFIVVLIAHTFICKLQAQVPPIDSAKAVFAKSQKDNDTYIKTCFFIADAYMNTEQYDSAQIWLNKIHEKIPAKNPSLFNYFLITRQAEVYYYNNLQQLGLQESFKGLSVAQALNDSLLLADSYNFLGLFYMNLDSSAAAIPFYKNGLRYTRQPPYPPQYFSLTKPHHLYGNMAEAWYNIKMYDSALVYIRLSLQKAYQIKWGRGIAVGHTSAGDIFLALQNTDSALQHYQQGKQAAKISKDIDVELLCYGGIAKCLDNLNNYPACRNQLDTAMQILQTNPTLNRFFTLHFLNSAIEIYKGRNEFAALSHILEIKSGIEMANIKNNNTQIQTILKAGVENEKHLLSLEVEDAQQKQNLANTRLGVVIIAFALLTVAFFWYRYSQEQKINLADMRHKISQDLHDDIGASLSSLQIYGAIAEKVIAENPAKAIEMVQKISIQSKLLMENMNDIVWSMKHADDNATTLETKIKNFGAELLSDKNINFTYQISNEAEAALISMHARKNILLLIKEAMNNIAKYSNAEKASLKMEINDKKLLLEITDNGIGFDTGKAATGNGLMNMNNRIKELKGQITIASTPGSGTTIAVVIPFVSIAAG